MKVFEVLIREGAYEAGVADGRNGTPDRRASSKYGPEINDYDRGYEDGVKQGKEEREKTMQAAAERRKPYEDKSDEELIDRLKYIRKRMDEIGEIARKKRGGAFNWDPKLHDIGPELKQENRALNAEYDVIANVLYARGVDYRSAMKESADENTSEGRLTNKGLRKAKHASKASGRRRKSKLRRNSNEAHGNSKIYDKCWDGYKKVPGKKRGEPGSCVKETATSGGTSAGAIATVSNPSVTRNAKKPKKNKNGTAPNALDSNTGLMSGTLIKR